MCRALQVNRTSFHDWERRAPSDRALGDAWLIDKIKTIHADSDGTYGARRVHAELRLEHGVRVGRKRVERLMRVGVVFLRSLSSIRSGWPRRTRLPLFEGGEGGRSARGASRRYEAAAAGSGISPS